MPLLVVDPQLLWLKVSLDGEWRGIGVSRLSCVDNSEQPVFHRTADAHLVKVVAGFGLGGAQCWGQ